MPLARTQVDRETKLEEILDSAERRLLAGGYEEMSVAAIARELGIAQNSIYWYYPSKDELFVAVLGRIIGRLAAKKPPKDKGLVAQVLWATDRMHDLSAVRSDLRERAKHSAVAAEFDKELAELLRRLLMHGIEPYLQNADVEVAATTFLATVEGTFALALKRSHRHRTIRFALEQLTGVS